MKGHRAIVIWGTAAALLAAFSTQDASSQSAPARGRPTLSQQLLALERRVAELEQEGVATREEEKLGKASPPATLEQRLASLEKSLERLQADAKAKTEAKPVAPAQTVTAPFVVLDGSGKPIMRVVDTAADLSRGMYILNPNGVMVAHAGVLPSGGGRLYARGVDGGANAVQLAHTPEEGGTFRMYQDGKSLVVLNKQGFVYHNKAGVPAVKLGSGDGSAGFLQIADSAGNAAVEAGMTKDGRAIVRVFPNDGRTPLPWPQFLMGGRP